MKIFYVYLLGPRLGISRQRVPLLWCFHATSNRSVIAVSTVPCLYNKLGEASWNGYYPRWQRQSSLQLAFFLNFALVQSQSNKFIHLRKLFLIQTPGRDGYSNCHCWNTEKAQVCAVLRNWLRFVSIERLSTDFWYRPIVLKVKPSLGNQKCKI